MYVYENYSDRCVVEERGVGKSSAYLKVWVEEQQVEGAHRAGGAPQVMQSSPAPCLPRNKATWRARLRSSWTAAASLACTFSPSFRDGRDPFGSPMILAAAAAAGEWTTAAATANTASQRGSLRYSAR